MKRKLFFGALVAIAIGTTAFLTSEGDPESLAIGAKAPMTDYVMTDVNGTKLTLQRAAGENGVLVVFSCNTCPFVVGRGEKSEGWEGRYNMINDMAKKQGVNMILVNSNEAKREGDDSMSAMKEHSKSNGYKMPYVVDTNHELADAFGARTTPHVYLFNKNMELVYKGAIDDNVDSAKGVKQNYLKDAIGNMVAGKKVDPNSTKPLGCSIKRVSK
jgi:hypothetical protein